MGQEMTLSRSTGIAIAGADHNDLLARLGETDWQDIIRFAKAN